MRTKVASYGSWESPITSDLVASGTVTLGTIALDDTAAYWLEGRPSANGRAILVKWTPENGVQDMTGDDFSVRSRVHEYGGGAFTVHKETLFFINYTDQSLYRQDPNQAPIALTPDAPLRYADMIVDAAHGRLICVREDHTLTDQEASNTLVSIPLTGQHPGEILVSGNDFYASPRLSPDGQHLAWLTWNHPNMPWDGTELWVATIAQDGSLTNHTCVAGGVDESIFQPEWSPDGILYFVSDKTNWWNLYRWRSQQIEPVYTLEAEFGRPQWALGMTTYGFASANTIICSYNQKGAWALGQLDIDQQKLTPIDTPFTTIGYYSNLVVGEGYAFFGGGAPDRPDGIIRLDLSTHQWQTLRVVDTWDGDANYYSIAQAIEYPTSQNQTAHAFYYPPHNPDYVAPKMEKPPLVVISHGGPTSTTYSLLNPLVQYWTSRGFAVLDVNYRGSTGYGRVYRQQLNDQWGIADVEDCLNGALYLVEKGLVDKNKLAIRGGSAGGYTTLSALTFHNTFQAGASHFGVSDLEALTLETHKFESRYLDNLIGPYPEARAIYRARSPIHFVDHINCPLILFQGLDDKVVLPNQAEIMYEAIREKGIPVAYIPFPGEAHGFRKAENIKKTLDAELYFYSKVFGFELNAKHPSVPIDNL